MITICTPSFVCVKCRILLLAIITVCVTSGGQNLSWQPREGLCRNAVKPRRGREGRASTALHFFARIPVLTSAAHRTAEEESQSLPPIIMIVSSALLRRLLLAVSLSLLTSLLLFTSPTQAVRYNDFKKCADSSFCRRLRRLSSYTSNIKNFSSPYSLPSSSSSLPSFDASTATLTSPIRSALYPDVQFEVSFTFHRDGTARVRMDQVGERYGGWKRYDEAGKWAYEREPVIAGEGDVDVQHKDGETVAT